MVVADFGDRVREVMLRLEDVLPKSTGAAEMQMWEVIARLVGAPIVEEDVEPALRDEVGRALALYHRYYFAFVTEAQSAQMIAAVAFQQGVTFAVAAREVLADDAE